MKENWAQRISGFATIMWCLETSKFKFWELFSRCNAQKDYQMWGTNADTGTYHTLYGLSRFPRCKVRSFLWMWFSPTAKARLQWFETWTFMFREHISRCNARRDYQMWGTNANTGTYHILHGLSRFPRWKVGAFLWIPFSAAAKSKLITKTDDKCNI